MPIPRRLAAAAVLSLGKLSLGQEAYYLTEVLDGAEDYYLNAGEAPGRWTGQGAVALGLSGRVEAEALRAVLSGCRPDGTPLRATRAGLPGMDVTLKAPKSVSLVWGLGDEDTAAAVAAHEAGVDAALGYLESHACQVRRGRAGLEVQDAAGFVAAAFRHRTSRAGIPPFTPMCSCPTWRQDPTVDGRLLTPGPSTPMAAPLGSSTRPCSATGWPPSLV